MLDIAGTTTAGTTTAGTDNNVCIFTQNPTDLIADLNGYFPL